MHEYVYINGLRVNGEGTANHAIAGQHVVCHDVYQVVKDVRDTDIGGIG